jgi:hypothetical protein
MTSIKSIVPLVGILFPIALSAKTAWGQDEQTYQEEIKPGLSIRASSSDKSVLSEAARTGRSVVISAAEDEEPASFQLEHSQIYTVKEGDTLWGICAGFFGDPYVWPQVWSYNPKITNPNWIYPGDYIRLAPYSTDQVPVTGVGGDTFGVPFPGQPGGDILPIGAISRIPSASLIRNRGFVDKKLLKQAGTLVGSHKILMLLSQYDEAYVEFKKNEHVNPGDEFAAYHIVRGVDSVEDPGTEVGKLVEIYGQVRVTRFDKEKRIARVVIDESLRPIERGTLIGPVHRRFDLVPVVPNDRDIDGHIIAFMDPIILSATHHVVFIDRGSEDGVREGNRFFAVEVRDNYRASLDEPDDREGYPTEVLAELRVIETRAKTSTCLITSAIRELEVGQQLEMRKGY